jgi:excisionase family DNA binding protein
MKKALLNVRELSQYTGLARGTIYNYVSQRRIPFVKLGRKTAFDIKAIDRWIEENSFSPTDAPFSTRERTRDILVKRAVKSSVSERRNR